MTVVVVIQRLVEVIVIVSAMSDSSGVGLITIVVGSGAVVTEAYVGGGPYSQEVVPLDTAYGYMSWL